MSKIFYLIAIVLAALWAIVFFGFNVGGLIHLLLFLAFVSFLLRAIKEDNLVYSLIAN